MQKRFPQSPITRKMLPLALSALFAISAIGMDGMMAATKTATPQQIAAQAKKKPAGAKQAAPKTEVKKDEKADGKDKPPSATPAEIDASIAGAQAVDSLEIMKNPNQYLNKKVTFTGTFNRFADIGLDYKKAFRDSRDYVTFFVLRPDVKEHTIPMAEMKLFFPRKKSDEVMDLESGDKIQLVGTEFSTALDEPWIDVEHIKILEKIPRADKKHEAPEF
ncbi:MAG TPA: hypothetical protein V6C52_07285 [Coleofasciculaceae cyanobacterium]|jgi:hypothetical protein